MRLPWRRSGRRLRLRGAATTLLVLLVGAVCAIGASDALAEPLPTSLTLGADPAAIASGGAATLTIRISVPNASLTISGKTLGDPDYTFVAALVTDDDGAATYAVQPAHTTIYRVRYAGDEASAAAEAEAPVAVHPGITLVATPSSVRWDGSTTLSASFDLPNTTLTLSRKHAGKSGFAFVKTITAGADGKFSMPINSCRTSATYRLEFAGDGVWAPVAAEAVVAVRPRITLIVSPNRVYEGWKVSFAGSVTPAHPGAQVALERLTGGGWKTVRKLTLSSKSSFAYRWKSVGRGTSEFRVTMAADAEHAKGTSPRRSVRLTNPNPYGVPAGAPRFIVVDKSLYKLYYHEYGRVVRVFPCVLGKRSTPTPLGRFRIYAMDKNMWGAYGPRRMRYKGLFAIHGTNEPWLLSRFPRAYSHGCTRLSNTNIRWLFDRCRVGTPIWNVR